MAINDEAEIRTFINHDNERFEHISLDLLTKNLYFIKDGYGIGVCDKDAKNCINLIRASTHQQRFRNLILHNRRGTMFWIQDDSKSIVNIAGMDGKNVSLSIVYYHSCFLAPKFELFKSCLCDFFGQRERNAIFG